MLDLIARARRSYSDLPRFVHELIILGISLLLGFVIVPLVIWMVGNRILGPYPHGSNLHAGPMALLGDFFSGLSAGYRTFWVVAFGPLVIISLGRLAWFLVVPRNGGRSSSPDQSPPANKSNPKTRQRIEPTVAKDGL